MNKIMILLVALVFTSSPAFAFFTNLGFETGDTSGWTIDKDYSVISSYTGQFNNTSDWEADIPFYGDYSLLLGSPGVGNEYDHAHQGKASQIAAISHADIVSGLDLYLEWGAILEEPTNAVVHTKDEQPYFSIAVSSSDDDGATWSSLYYANQYANESGLTYLGTNARGASGNIWYGSGSTIIDLAGLSEGDLLKIKLFVRDCGEGGHGGLAFFDAYAASTQVPEPNTLFLFGAGLGGLLAFTGFRKISLRSVI